MVSLLNLGGLSFLFFSYVAATGGYEPIEECPPAPVTEACVPAAAGQKPFTIRAYQDGYPNPGNLTNYYLTYAPDGGLVLAPPASNSSTTNGTATWPEAVLYVDNAVQRAYTYSASCQQSIFVDVDGQWRYQRISSDDDDDEPEKIPADAIIRPFYRFGKNPDKLVYMPSETGTWTNPGPSILTFSPWFGMGYWACPVNDGSGTYSIWTRFLYWLPFDPNGTCIWLWLVALDYTGPLVE